MTRKEIRFLSALISLLTLLLSLAVAAAQRPPQPEDFTIVNANMLDSEDGYPIDADSEYFPGERVFLRFNVGGYTRGEFDRVHISWQIDSFGPEGRQFVEQEQGFIDTELSPQDKEWLPIIRHSPMIPPHAGAGTYRVVLRVVDELSRKEVIQEMPIRVVGMRLEAAEGLTIRSLSFQRTAEGEKLAAAPVYRRGDQVWMTFYITGYQLGEDNAFTVRSNLRLFNAEDEVVLRLPPHEEKGATFYPRRWLPATLRLDLDPMIPNGEYDVVISLEDGVSGATHESTYSFTVR